MDLNQSLSLERNLSLSVPREWDLNQPLPQEQDLNQSVPQERDLNQSLPHDWDMNQSPPQELTPSAQTSEDPEIANFNLEEYHQKMLKLSLVRFWNQQTLDMLALLKNPVFKNQIKLPLTRIRKVMKSDPNVKMVSFDCPILLAKACELFILELTICAWRKRKESKHKSLQRCDIAQAVIQDDSLNFLANTIPLDDDDKFQDDAKNCSEGGHADISPRLPDLSTEYVPSSPQADQVLITPASIGFNNGHPTKMMRSSKSVKGKAMKW